MTKQESSAELEKRIVELRGELESLVRDIQGPPFDDEPDLDQEVESEAQRRGVPEEIVRAEWLKATVDSLERKLKDARAKEEEVRLAQLTSEIRLAATAARDQSVAKLRNRVAVGAAALTIEDLRIIPSTSWGAHSLALRSLAFAVLAAAMVSVGYVASVAVWGMASLRAPSHAREVIEGLSHLQGRLERRIRAIELFLVTVQIEFVLAAMVLTFVALSL